MAFHRKLAALIIRGRYVLLAVLLLASVFAAAGVSRTRINYDMTEYLAEDTVTIRGLRVMWDEFGAANSLESSTRDTGDSLKDLQVRIGREIPVALAIAVAVVLAMLTVTSHAWLEPLLISFVLAVSIVLNMGTNFLFPKISFITFAICPILQLALSIDYAIMLLHAFSAYRESGMEAKEAMTEALAECFMRISSSALTTVAGLLSLLFMSFTIGFDIGMALSKGILFSMLGVFTLMPAVTLLAGRALEKTRHRPLSVGGDRPGGTIYRIRKPLAACMALLVLGAFWLNTRVNYTFTDSNPKASPVALIVPGGGGAEDYARQRELISRLKELKKDDGTPAAGRVLSMVSEYSVSELAGQAGIPPLLLKAYCVLYGLGDPVPMDRLLDSLERNLDPALASGAGALNALAGWITGQPAEAGPSRAASRITEFRDRLRESAETIRSGFIGKRHSRLAVYLNFTPADEGFIRYMDGVLDAARGIYGSEVYATGVPISTYDISNSFNGDRLKVNLITLAAIFLIIAFSFRSLRMPVLLAFVIEGAIWMTIGISALVREPVFFISYLICISIQMGATIDYGILLCDQYRSRRREGLAPREAVAAALKKSLPTVLTSGVILIVAGYAIGRVCTIYYIYSIGLLVSRGALISVVLMLTFLPALLALFDRFIIRGEKASAGAAQTV